MAQKLAKRGIHTVVDLLFYFPYKYQDRTRITPIVNARHQDWCVIEGTVTKSEITFGKRRSLKCLVDDQTGFLRVRFFHFNKSQQNALSIDTRVRLFGEIKEFNGVMEVIHPEYQIIKQDEILTVEETLTPIYSAISGLSQTRIRQLIQNALLLLNKSHDTIELLPDDILNSYRFPTLKEAINFLHKPPPDAPIIDILEGNHPTQQRLAFEELLSHYLSLKHARNKVKQLSAPKFKQANTLSAKLLEKLPFKLTNAQRRTINQINDDLLQPYPMQRLVQGDVGSGKTVVAALSALKAIESGFQVALMAPTEILAEQHAILFNQWFMELGLTTVRLTGSLGAKAKRQALSHLKENTAHIAIGTHALFQENVEFSNLGLVIIDEQHRFGVSQRLSLQQKRSDENTHPHQLIMTATPIPRTLAMTSYADLDISIIDELPPGRTPITTAVIANHKRDEIILRLANAINQKKQAYWVCTLIEESEKLQCMAAENTAQLLKELLPNSRVGLVHGRMKPKDKEAIMHQFKEGLIDLLVATTVIEVGVNVPNASMMIIENSERLGLSQLHQLRGRVGRGNAKSHCVLLYQTPLSHQSHQRLKVMRQTNDGFVIAEKDLELRGAGEILGTKQTGVKQLKIACLKRDKALFNTIPAIAKQIAQLAPENIPRLVERWLGSSEQYLQS